SPGSHSFRVSVPPGWVVTSGNAVQTRLVKRVEGSPAGLGTEEMLKPVGLAPLLHVAGLTAPDIAVRITALRSGLALSSQPLAPGKPFRFALPDGADSVRVDGDGIGQLLPIGPYPLQLGLLAAGRAAPLRPDAPMDTIDFEGVTPEELKKIPNNYAGLDWFNLN